MDTVYTLDESAVDNVYFLYGYAVDTVCILYESAVDTVFFCTDMLWTLCVPCRDLLWTMYALYDSLWTLPVLHYGPLVDTVYIPVCITLSSHVLLF